MKAKSNHSIALTAFFIFSLQFVFCLVWVFKNWNALESPFFSFYQYAIATVGFLALMAALLSVFTKKLKNIFILPLFFGAFYIFIEVFLFIFPIELPVIEKNIDPFGQFGYFSGEAAEFNRERGYQWKEGEHRLVKFIDHKIIYDNTFKANNQGCVSSYNYTLKKKDNSKRYIVFGDSFTASEYLDTTWPDLCHELSLLEEDSASLEFYNFAIDGGGLPGWHRSYFEEIKPNFEYDAIVLAIFGNDLERGMVSIHHDAPFSYTGSLDSTELALPLDSILMNFRKEKLVLTDDQIDSIKIFRSGLNAYYSNKAFSFNWYIYRNFESLASNLAFSYMIKGFLKDFIYDEDLTTYRLSTYENKYSKEARQRLEAIIQSCKENNKELIFLSVPEKYGISLQNTGKDLLINKELSFLSNHYQVGFINGYEFFNDIKQDELEKCYLQHDGHWNNKGIEIFAEGVYENLKK